jgi:hypothetical protein
LSVHFRLLLAAAGIVAAVVACGVETNPLQGLFTDPTGETMENGAAGEAASAGSPGAQAIRLGLSSADSGLEQLESYRANLILDFEGTLGAEGSAGHLESLTEVNRSAAALHRYMNIEADIPNVEQANGVSEFFRIGDEVYINQAGEALQFRAESNARALPGDLGFYELEQLIVLPSTVRQQPQLENLNGQHVLRYSFDQDDLESADINFEQAKGDAWITGSGDYLVQYVISATVDILTPLPNARLMDQGRLNIQYKLTDINASIPIASPKRTAALTAPFAEFPAPPRSELTAIYPTFIEYTSVISPISATLFYQGGLAANGWTEESTSIFNEKSRLTFSKDDQLLTIIVTPAEDPDKIKIVLDVVSQR